MREKYFAFISENNLVDILSQVQTIPYSLKLKYLIKLKDNFSVSILNRALDQYKKNYIDVGRVNEILIYNHIAYFCKKFTGRE